ncbi:hypothetical protein EJB05_46696 [Eragrostis curvula]|uniref:Uncharacterized protein n=1 Tax=Eragrostis curvula TaxID=38414 RepID=A0A5J9TNV6_9POAL|nr:hypothetical protein EJB05_46696 [Eragrostis curvula]
MDDKVVRLVCWWSLVCGFSTALSFVGFVDFFLAAATCSLRSWMLPCVVLKEERVVEADDLENQMLWLAAAQTAAATLALLLVAGHGGARGHRLEPHCRILLIAGAGGDHPFLCIIIVVTDLFSRVTDGMGIMSFTTGLLQLRPAN